jgi:hypothetical protein
MSGGAAVRTVPRVLAAVPARVLRWAGVGLAAAAVLGMTAFASLAIHFRFLSWGSVSIVLAALFALGTIAAFVVLRPRRALPPFVVAIMPVLAWHLSQSARNDRDFKPEFSRLATAEFTGDLVTVRNVRDFTWGEKGLVTESWYDTTYDLRELRTIDFAICLWTSGSLGHVLVSFGFAGGRYLAASVEARQERSETYAPLDGMFRRFELQYILADERDVLHLRAAVRDESVYLYRVRTTPDRARRVLTDYLERANALAKRPAFYNSLVDNCTTNVLAHARAVRPDLPWSWELLVNGFSDRYAYEHGLLASDLPFQDLREKSRINEAARAAGRAGDFSARVRNGLP